MNLKSKLAILALAAVTIVGSAAGAFAHDSGGAIIRHGTALYANPGSHQIGYVSGGTWVHVGSCYSEYCWISKPGHDGWVASWDIDWHYSDYGYGYGYGGGYGYGYDDHHSHHEHAPVILVP
jgi:hypothetical protein